MAGGHGDEAAGSCANCSAVLQGPFCHECGQKAHLHHRLSHLLEELIEGIAHFDGRLWRTLPLLLRDPGRLSREWREGKRVRYVAPLHFFLFAVFLFFLTPTLTGGHLVNLSAPAYQAEGVGGQKVVAPISGLSKAQLDDLPKPAQDLVGFLAKKGEKADYYGYKTEVLAYKLSFMVVPISMAILWVLLLFPRGRGHTLYDHGVVSLYGVGLLALLMVLVNLAPKPVDGVLLVLVSLFAPLHAIAHLRGAYGLSWFGAAWRGVLLGGFSVVGFLLFMLAVLFLGLAS